MSWKEKLDNFWKGLAIGVLFPALCFFCYWLFLYIYMDFPGIFVKYLFVGQIF